MAKFRLNKLVRDKFVGIYEGLNEKAEYRYLKKDEHIKKLADKVREEAGELSLTTHRKAAEEIADVQQAINDLKTLYGLKETDVKKAMKTKLKEKGGFLKGLYIETLEMRESDKWASYYRKEPKRFPEDLSARRTKKAKAK